MAEIGDRVKYGAYGECKILDRRMESLSGRSREYYILTQCGNTSSTIYVPVEKAAYLREVKKALSVKEIKALLLDGGARVDWNADEKARDVFFRQAFERADIAEICGILKDILRKQSEYKATKKKLRSTDLNALKVCEKIVYEEFSRSLDLKPEDVVPLLTGTVEPKAK